jgi:hypothetical protein
MTTSTVTAKAGNLLGSYLGGAFVLVVMTLTVAHGLSRVNQNVQGTRAGCGPCQARAGEGGGAGACPRRGDRSRSSGVSRIVAPVNPRPAVPVGEGQPRSRLLVEPAPQLAIRRQNSGPTLRYVWWRAFPSVCASACPIADEPLSRDWTGTVIGPRRGPPLSQIALHSELAFELLVSGVVWAGLK